MSETISTPFTSSVPAVPVTTQTGATGAPSTAARPETTASADTVSLSDTKAGKGQAKVVALLADGTEAGLRNRPFYQGTAPVPGGDPTTPVTPMWTVAADSNWHEENPDSTANVQKTDITYAELDALDGQGFNTVAATINTPERVAEFLAHNMTYDDDRAENSTGTWAAESSQEVLAQGDGVCRDQHALARDLLQANGINAELLAYGAPGQFHAITVYQDPATGYWGLIEYGTIYQASELKAKTAEDALLQVRPGTMQIWHMSDGGPTERSVADRTTYTRTFRTLERFMSGPAAGNGATVKVTTDGASYSTPVGDGKTQIAGQVLTSGNPALKGAVMAGAWRDLSDHVRVGAGAIYAPENTIYAVGSNREYEKATVYSFASIEEHHPAVVGATNLAGTGIDVRVSSHTKAHATLGLSVEKEGGFTDSSATIASNSLSLSKGTTNPELHLSKDFSVWKAGAKDTTLDVRYGVGFDLGLQATHLAQGGDDVLVNQYVAADLTTRIGRGTEVAVGYYQPITNVTNDFAATPTGYVAVTTPNVRLSTTQSLDAGRYEAAAGAGTKRVFVSGYGVVDHDRRSEQVATEAGLQIEFKDKKKKK